MLNTTGPKSRIGHGTIVELFFSNRESMKRKKKTQISVKPTRYTRRDSVETYLDNISF